MNGIHKAGAAIAAALCLAVAAAGCGERAGQVAIVLPWARHTIDDTSRGADGVRLMDVNGDGRADIATGWEEGGKVRVYLHPGPDAVRDTWPRVTVGRVGAVEDAVFVDLDDDGATDVVSASEGGVKTVHVHWAPADSGRYLDPSAWETQALPASKDRRRWMFLLPMQVDGAGGIDLVAGAKGDQAAIGWFASPADARNLGAWQWHPLYDAGWIMSLIAADMDNDGDMDIVASDRKGDRRGCLWLEHPGPDGNVTAPWAEHRVSLDDGETMFIDLADLDDDGRKDIVAARRGDDLVWYRRTSDESQPWRAHRIAMPAGTGTGKSVRVGDINGDGRRDLVVSCENAKDKSGVFWLSYASSPTDPVWVPHPISGTAGTKFDLVQLIDLDDDGDLDVLTCEESENLGVIWYENRLGDGDTQ